MRGSGLRRGRRKNTSRKRGARRSRRGRLKVIEDLDSILPKNMPE